MTACGKTLLQKAPILMALAVALLAIALISMTFATVQPTWWNQFVRSARPSWSAKNCRVSVKMAPCHAALIHIHFCPYKVTKFYLHN